MHSPVTLTVQESPQPLTNALPSAPPKPLWRKVLKYALITLSTFTGLILIACILIPVFFEDEVKGLFIKELNKNLATEVSVQEEDIELSLFRHFPEASVVFHNVGIRESFSHSGKNFLQAEEISLLFNIRNILNGKYTIHNILIKNGFCKLITDKKGDINYHFWKSSDDTTSSTAFELNLEKVVCDNIDFQYLDYKYKQDVSLLLHHAQMSGNFSADQYTLRTEGDILSRRISISGNEYLVNKETTINTKIKVDVPAENYSFDDGTINIGENTFAVNGAITLLQEDHYDLKIEGKKINLEGLLLLLPGDISTKFNAMQTKGAINFRTTINGYYTKTKTPAIDITFDMKNGSISHSKFGGKLSAMTFTGNYSNGAAHNATTSSVQLENFTAEQDGRPVTLSLNYKNFIAPVIDLQLNGDFPAALIIPLAIENAADVEGMIGLHAINIRGNLKMLSDALAENQPAGTVVFKDVAFSLNGEKIAIPEGNAVVANNTIQCTNLSATCAGSDLLINAEINNWIENVFPSGVKPALYINGSIRSQKTELNRLMAAFAGKKEAPSGYTKEEQGPDPAFEETKYNFSGHIDLSCTQFLYNKIEFNAVRAILKLTPGLLIVNDLKGNAMGGSFNLNGTIREVANGDILMETSGTLNTIDVAQLFYQFENFDQHTLTDKNIKGKISANIYDVSLHWDKNFVLDEKSVYTLCDMKIENGELINYKPLESLSAFVKLQDLQHIVFSTLENKIEIKDRVINIPAMQIRSSAVDLYLSGKHTFDNKIDYQFRLSLADMMVRKFLGGNKEKDNYEEDAEGGVNVFISMTGTVDDPVIEYNKREAKQKLKESGLEGQKFMDIFKRDPEEELFKKEEINNAPEPDTTDTPAIEFIEFDDAGE